jgi:hypothetical protein
VGRALLSVAFDFGSAFQNFPRANPAEVHPKIEVPLKIKGKINGEGGGQECPPHLGCFLAANCDIVA